MKNLLKLCAIGFPPLAIASTYLSTFTPHGRMDFRAALSLKWLSFEKEIKPVANSDFAIRMPVNLLYAINMMLPKEPVAKTRDVSIPSGPDEIGGRLYWPGGYDAGQGPVPLVVYFHGGGFVVGSVDLFDALARSLANATNSIVLSVDYRLAPEFPYPTPGDDAYAGLLWAAENAAWLGADPDRIAVAGDSAGGNLAAVSALRARDANGPKIAAQLLFYPATDLTNNSYPSREKFMEGYGMSNEAADAFSDAYLGHVSDEDRASPDISPLHAPDHSALPPTLLVTAGFDPITDCARTYGSKLRNCGVTVVEDHHPNTLHGFMSINMFTERRRALNNAGNFVASVLNS